MRALAQQLGEDVDEVLKRIREAQDELRSEGQAHGRSGGQRRAIRAPDRVRAYSENRWRHGDFDVRRDLLEAGREGRGELPQEPRQDADHGFQASGGAGASDGGTDPVRSSSGTIPPQTRYLTFLREPVDRLLSHYHRHVHRPDISPEDRRDLERRGKPTAASIEEALEMGLPQLSNVATRLLCSDPAPPADLPDSALEEAKSNLTRFAFVGIQERFDESIVLLQRTLALDLVPSADRHVSVERPAVDEIPDERRALIIERMSEAANEEFQAGVRDARDWLDRELPVGSTKSLEAVVAAAEDAGISFATFRRARRLLGAQKGLDHEGQRTLTRPEASVAPGN